MSEIFISYSRKDKQFVSRLATDLERQGWDVYYDLKLKPSQNYEDVLSEKAGLAKYFLAVLSPNSLQSEWVQKEVIAALDREKQRHTTVVPLLAEASDPQAITKLIGPKYYADFTNDYDEGFKEMLSALEPGSSTAEHPKPETSGGQKTGRWKDPAIVTAIITGAVTLVVAYWQFVYKPAHSEPPPPVQYTARVTDANTQQPIRGAHVSIETQGTPQVYYSDSDGVLYLKLPGSVETARVRVAAVGYQPFDRNVSLSRTGVDEFRLLPNPSPNATPTPGRIKKQSRPDQINRILRSEPSNKPG